MGAPSRMPIDDAIAGGLARCECEDSLLDAQALAYVRACAPARRPAAFVAFRRAAPFWLAGARFP